MPLGALGMQGRGRERDIKQNILGVTTTLKRFRGDSDMRSQ